MKRILSYFWPQTVKKSSVYNGTLEITWYNGKKLLNSKNANYSFGSLQKVLDFGLSKVNLHQSAKILLLGLGGGSIIQTIREEYQLQSEITAVEIDEEVIKLAKNEFNVASYKNVTIHHANALAFVKTRAASYDFVIVDVFIDDKVPSEFYKNEFWSDLNKILLANGTILFNAGMQYEAQKDVKKLQSTLSGKFKVEEYKYKNQNNTLLVVKPVKY